MLINSLRLINYRNYKDQLCEFSPNINLLIGSNAQGKTNLLEAIYYLSIGKAYRPVKDEQLILWDNKEFHISGNLQNRQGTTKLEANYDKEIKKGKTFNVGGIKLSKNEELSGNLTSVLFSPDNMSIIKGSPNERRRFLDYDISQISRVYSKNLIKYQRLLNQRNMLLKQIIKKGKNKSNDLEIWDQQLIDIGSQIIEKRIQTLAKLNPLTRLMHRKISKGQENIELHYIFNRKKEINNCNEITQHLRDANKNCLEEDLRYGVTQWGPHRDDLLITINGFNLKLYGSQGQQRTAVLALKLAELEFFRGETGEYPILLLDDVMSELDQDRQIQLIDLIQEKAIQCFITTTELLYFENQEKRDIKSFKVKQGKIIEM